MAHLGTLGHYKFQDNVNDVRGTDVYGRDHEKLGTVDDVIFDHDTCEIQHIVVDTGGWLSSRKFTIPADRVSLRGEGDLQADVTRDQVQQRFPKYEENVHQDQQRWNDYDNRHREAYTEAGGVLHKEGSPNLITPDPDEMPAASGDIQGDFTPDRMAGKYPDTAPGSGKIRMRPSGTAARAEDTSIPGTAQNTETARWQDPDETLRQDDRGDVTNRDYTSADRDFTNRDVTGDVTEKDRYIISRDTGHNISNADLAEGTRDRLRNPDDVRDTSAYGDVNRTAVPRTGGKDPSSYREKFDGVEEDLHRPYPVQQGRNQRFQEFEENLRRNRVDITASCRSCGPAKDKAA
jgi:sporulation protein YlmC with PRC-barrel domain